MSQLIELEFKLWNLNLSFTSGVTLGQWKQQKVVRCGSSTDACTMAEPSNILSLS